MSRGNTTTLRSESLRAAEAQHYIAKRNASQGDLASAQQYIGRVVTLQVDEIDKKACRRPPRYRCIDAFLDELHRLILVLQVESVPRAQSGSFGGGAASVGL